MNERRQKRRVDRAAAAPKRRSAGPSPVATQSPLSDSALPLAGAIFSGRALWISIALIAANVVIYSAVLHYGFVRWDDPEYVSENPYISGGLTWSGVSWAFATGSANYWHPLTWLSHMLDVQLFGLDAGRHHLINVLLHIANTLLLFGLLHSATGTLGRSSFVAGLFALHPLHVESVAWVAERKDVLSTLFWMLTVWAYVAYVRRPRLGRYLAVLLLFALALMAKPMVVTLPFVLLLLDYWPLARVAPGTDRSAWFRLALEKLPLFAIAAALGVVTFLVQRQQGAVAALEALPLESRAENAVVSYFAYVAHMLWPMHLAVFYPLTPSLPGWQVVGSILGLIGVSVAVIAARSHRYLAVGWMWYLGTLVPVIGLVQVGQQSMADRYTYVPLIGLFLIAAWGIPELLGNWPYRRIALPAGATLVLGACAIAARGQVEYWKSNFALWEHAVRVTTGNYLAHNNLGVGLADQGQRNEAVFHFSEAVRIKSDYPEAHNNLGLALASQGNISAAISHYSEAVRLRPGFALAHDNLAKALSAQGRFDEAIAQYSEVVRIKPGSPVALADLAGALASQGKIDRAIVHYSEAVRLKPDFAEAHNNLGFALAGQGKVDEAISQYSEAVRFKPDFVIAHNNLGTALAGQGRVDEAIREFEAALRIKPNDASIHYNLGVLLNRKGDTAQAVEHFETAVKLTQGYPEAQRALDSLRSRSKSQ